MQVEVLLIFEKLICFRKKCGKNRFFWKKSHFFSKKLNKIDIFSHISNKNYNNSEKKWIFLFLFSQGKWRKKWSFFDNFVKNDGSNHTIFKFWWVKKTICSCVFVKKSLFSKNLIYSCDFEKKSIFSIFLTPPKFFSGYRDSEKSHKKIKKRFALCFFLKNEHHVTIGTENMVNLHTKKQKLNFVSKRKL